MTKPRESDVLVFSTPVLLCEWLFLASKVLP